MSTRTLRIGTLLTAAWIALLALGSAPAIAQDRDRDRDHDRDQDRDRTRLVDPTPAQPDEALRARLQSGIDQAPGLTDQERTRMRDNLHACLRLDLSAGDLEAVFPGPDGSSYPSAKAMLRFQDQVLKLAGADTPIGPLVAKIREGRIKNIPEAALDQACRRVESHLEAAHQVMDRARAAGLERPDDPARTRRMEVEMAQQMWRGMTQEGLERITDQARMRLREGPCTIEDVVAASDAATRFEEAGVGSQESIRVCGDALRRGYRAGELRDLGYMAMATHRRGSSMNEFMNGLQYCLGEQMAMGDMYQYMMQHGWMGPGDMDGMGGHTGADDRMGPGHMGSGDGSDGHGGMGGGGGGSGGMGNHGSGS